MMYKEKYLALVNAFADDPSVLELIEGCMNSFVEYVQRVVRIEYCQPLYYARYEGQELRDKIMDLDRRRRDAHELAITKAGMMERFACMGHVEPIFSPATEDEGMLRYEVADFCEALVSEFFGDRDRIGRISI